MIKQQLIRALKTEGAKVSVEIVQRALAGSVAGRRIAAVYFTRGVVLSLKEATDSALESVLRAAGVALFRVSYEDVDAIRRFGVARWKGLGGDGEPYRGGPPTEAHSLPQRWAATLLGNDVVLIASANEVVTGWWEDPRVLGMLGLRIVDVDARGQRIECPTCSASLWYPRTAQGVAQVPGYNQLNCGNGCNAERMKRPPSDAIRALFDVAVA